VVASGNWKGKWTTIPGSQVESADHQWNDRSFTGQMKNESPLLWPQLLESTSPGADQCPSGKRKWAPGGHCTPSPGHTLGCRCRVRPDLLIDWVKCYNTLNQSHLLRLTGLLLPFGWGWHLASAVVAREHGRNTLASAGHAEGARVGAVQARVLVALLAESNCERN
jgi:hypothetical protein